MTTIPILPLPYDSVLFPGRKLQINASDRQDVIAIIAEYYNRSLSDGSKKKTAVIGCVPLRSPYLSGDGQYLIESGGDEGAHRIPRIDQVKRKDLFNYGVLATISSVEGGRSGELKIVVEGLQRFKLDKITAEKPYLAAKVKAFVDEGMEILFCHL